MEPKPHKPRFSAETVFLAVLLAAVVVLALLSTRREPGRMPREVVIGSALVALALGGWGIVRFLMWVTQEMDIGAPPTLRTILCRFGGGFVVLGLAGMLLAIMAATFPSRAAMLPYCIPIVFFLAHALILLRARRMGTHAARRLILLVLLCLGVLIPVTVYAFNASGQPGEGPIAASMGVALAMVVALLCLPGFVVYSIPTSSVFGLVPLLLYYLVIYTGGFTYPLILFAYLPMAGYLFPTHRRLMEYWRPPRLPRIRPNQSGVTLIELLIEVAILAILIAGAAQLVSTTHSVLERQERRRRAVALAEDEIALLRARPTVPAVGVHPVEPELRSTYLFADDAQVEIRPGPTDRLREVRVNIRPRGEARDPDMAVAAILPSARAAAPVSAGPASEHRDVKGKIVSGRTHRPQEAQP